MHPIAVCIKHILCLITGKEPEDSLSVKNAEQSFNRFAECWVRNAESCNNDVNKENEDSQQARKHAKKASLKKRDPVNSDEDVGVKKKTKTSSSQTSVKLPSAPFKLKPAEIK